MKKLIIITGIVLAVYLLLVTAAAPPAQAPSTAAAGEDSSAAEGFTVGVSDGRVAVFHDGALYLRTDTSLSSLPKSDRSRLEAGIHIDSIKELKSLLQDYCS